MLPTISCKEQDILSLLELKQPLSLFLSLTIIMLLFFVYFRELITFVFCGEIVLLFSFHKVFTVRFIFVKFCKVYFFDVSFLFMMAIYLFRFYMQGRMNCLLISLHDRLSYATQSDKNCEKLIKIRQIPSITSHFVQDPFCGMSKKPKLGSK